MYRPTIPTELDEFLIGAVNRGQVIEQYLASVNTWVLAVRIPLPLAGSQAFLLGDGQASWLSAARSDLIDRLNAAEPSAGFGIVAAWMTELHVVPVPFTIGRHIELLLRPKHYEARSLMLRGSTC